MAPTTMKRGRDDGDYVPSPNFKKAKCQTSDVQSEDGGEAQQAKLVIETSIADLGDVSTW